MNNEAYQYSQFVFEAISGKYSGISREYVEDQVKEVLDRIESKQTLYELQGECREIVDVEQDINNQVIALVTIRDHCNDVEFKTRPMLFLHRIVYSSDTENSKRSTTEVEGFPHALPTPIAETDARFQELEAMVKTLTQTPVRSVYTAAHLLAHVYAAIIRIHFFNDGNGRVARLTVQYLLRAWGAQFAAIPKVRNDPAWRAALTDAIDGDVISLALLLVKRLKESTKNPWEEHSL